MRIRWFVVSMLVGIAVVACTRTDPHGAAPPPATQIPQISQEPVAKRGPPAVTTAGLEARRPPLVITAPALGSSAIRVPSTMKQGREVIAQLIVSPSDLASLLRQGAVTEGPADVQATREKVRLTSRMRAMLLAPGFEVAPKEVQEQAVKVDEPTVWLWTLVPTDAGSRTLVFTLEGLALVDGTETSIRPPALQVPVQVEIDPLLFFEKYWQWLMTAIVIPLAVFLGKRWFDRRAVSNGTPS